MSTWWLARAFDSCLMCDYARVINFCIIIIIIIIIIILQHWVFMFLIVIMLQWLSHNLHINLKYWWWFVLSFHEAVNSGSESTFLVDVSEALCIGLNWSVLEVFWLKHHCNVLHSMIQMVTSVKLMTNARETRTRNLHEIEHALFDARKSREKYLAASRCDTRTSFSRELTRTSFSYVCHGFKVAYCLCFIESRCKCVCSNAASIHWSEPSCAGSSHCAAEQGSSE